MSAAGGDSGGTNAGGFGRRPLRRLAFGVAGLVIVWQIVATSLVGFLAGPTPEAALLIAPANPVALVALSDARLNAADGQDQGSASSAEKGADRTRPPLSPAERDEIREWIITALAQAPLDAAAFRILGQLAPETSAADFMEAAVHRSLHETDALYWLMQRRFTNGHYAEAARLADIFLLIRPRSLPLVTPFLARMAEKEDAIANVDRLLAGNPRWRDYFLNDLVYAIFDARTPLRLMLPLKDTPFPPTNETLRRYLDLLLRRGLYAFAFNVWRQFLPIERLQATGLLYNGDFEFPPSGLQFDWVIEGGAGVRIDVVARPDNEKLRALVLDYGAGRSAPHSVAQFVKLARGAYRMKGQFRGELAGRRGLRWRVTCANAGDTLGESEMALGEAKDWTPFQFDFIVPANNCGLQQVKLELAARSASEWIVSGKLWYSGLAIEPLAPAASSNERLPVRRR